MARNGKIITQEDMTARPNGEPTADMLGWQSALIDLSYEPIVVWEWNGAIIEWNTGAERLYGYSRAEAHGRISHDLLSTKHPISLRRFLKKLETDGYWVGEVRHSSKDGRELIVESRQQVIVLDGRRVVMESNRDITERRAGEGQVALLIIISELISKLNNPAELLFAASKAVGEYFKVSRCFFDEVKLEKDLEIVHRDYRRGVPSVAGKHKISAYSSITTEEMKAGRTVANQDSKTDPRTADLYEKTYKPAGERSYVAVPLMRDGQWRASLWIGDDQRRKWTEADVTLLEVVAERIWLAVEKRRNEGELRESIERFAKIFNSSPLAVTITSLKKGKLVDVNDTFVELTGYSRSEAIGRTTTELGLWQNPSQRDEELAVVVREGKVRNSEYRFRTRDGVEIVGLLSAELIEIGGEQCALTVIQDITQRKYAEDELRRIAEFDEAVMGNMGEGLYTVDAEGRVTTMNPAAEKLLGWKFSEISGRNMHEMVHHHYPDGRPFPIEECAGLRTLREGTPIAKQEDVFIHKDGTFFDVIYSSSPLNAADGKVIGLVVVFRDITERKKAEGLLERYRILSEKSGDIIWFLRPDGSFVDVNQAAVDTYGYTRDEFLKMTVRDLRHSSEIGEFQNQLDSARSIGTHFETVHMSKDGTMIPVEVKANSSLFGGERLIMAIVRDVTERKRADEALRKSEELFSRFMQHLPGLAWVKEVDGRYVYANDAAERAFRTPREQLYGESDAALFSPEVAEAFVANDQRALTEGMGVQAVETLEHEDGILHHSIVSKFPILGPDGSAQFIGGMAIDITDQMRAEEALRESEERLQLAQRAGNVAIFDWDIATGKTHMSENMGLFYGEMPRDGEYGKPFWNKYVHVNDLGKVERRVDDALRSGGNEYRDEFRIVGRDGSTRWIEAIAQISRDPSGAATRMYGVNLDITARREAEEKVRLSDNQLRLVTNAIPALISYVDNTGQYRFVNQKFTEWFDLPTDEVIGKSPRDVFGARAYKVLKPRIDEALAGQNCFFETVLNYETIGPRYVHISYISDVGADGTVYGYYGLTQDMTDLKHSEDLLRSSEERIGLMMDSFTEYAIFSMDVDGRIDSWNKGAEVVFGYEQGDIMGLSCEILFSSTDNARGVPLSELKTAKKKGKSSYEGWQVKKDGTDFFASAVVMPLFVGGELTGYAKIASDLTEKKRRDEELRRAHDDLELRVKERTRELAASNSALVQEMGEREVAERQKIDLLGRLVTSQEFERRRIARDLHDQLGQKLTALRLKIASLAEISAENKEFASRVERLQDIAQQLDSEVSFLAWELRPSALDDLGLRDAVGAFVNEWSHHYEISADFHSAGLAKERLEGDAETHLYRIAQEALNNIVKHAQAKHVTVMLERRDNSVILVVEDDGKGFDPVEKARSADSGKSLGLIGMSERAALVGGEVEIESARGKGTTIYVRVPFAANG